MTTQKITYLTGLCLFLLMSGCLVMDNPYTGMPPGTWRAILQVEPSYITPNPKGKPLPEKMDMAYEDITRGELPFLFEVSYPNPDSFFITLQLGADKLVLDDYAIGRDFSTAKDTITIRVPNSDNFLRGIFEEKIFEGHWVFETQAGVFDSLPLIARHGQGHLFTTLRKTPLTSVSGTWDLQLDTDLENAAVASLTLIQSGNALQGALNWQGRNFSTLSGTVQANKIYLSSFDGQDALLIEAKISSENALIGTVRKDNSGRILWQANKKS
jgi:hypothetical protein